jgi:hypothetical protein
MTWINILEPLALAEPHEDRPNKPFTSQPQSRLQPEACPRGDQGSRVAGAQDPEPGAKRSCFMGRVLGYSLPRGLGP